jgi:hypothetical protein
MNTIEIKNKLIDITKDFINDPAIELDEDDQKVLLSIVSDSVLAINYVSLLEDEFEIEFDDDVIDLDFFANGFDNLANIIFQQLKNNHQ